MEPPNVTVRQPGNSNWSKFRLLMWKNWLLQWRHPLQMVLEILVPVVFSALLVLIRSFVNPEIIADVTHYQPLSIDSLQELRNGTTYAVKFAFDLRNVRNSPYYIDYRLAYAPNTSLPLGTLVETASTALKLLPPAGYADSSALDLAMKQNAFLAALDFHPPPSNDGGALPKRLRYKLRFPAVLRTGGAVNPVLNNWFTNRMYPPFAAPGPRNRGNDSGGLPPGYRPEGFLAIQNAVADAFLRAHGGDPMPSIKLQRFPYPPFIDDDLLRGLENLVSLLIMLSFVYPATNTVKFIAAEKELQLKEVMKIMGLPNWLHWTGWFVRTMLYMSVSISLMVALLCVSWYPKGVAVSVFTYSSWSALWLFLFVYSIATTCFCFALSVFFARANTAAAVSGLVWFLSYSVFTFTFRSYDGMALAVKLLLSLLSNTGMAFGFQLIVRWEGTGEGLQWSNVWRPVTVDDNLSVGLTMVMLLVASLLYLLIALYVEKIYPGEYGVPERWWFPVSPAYWRGTDERTGDGYAEMHQAGAEPGENGNEENDPRHFEPEPRHRRAGVQVRGLFKVFGDQKPAVHPMHLNMYDDQITVLLGHNGAGKSTTMAMLTGMLRPTAGTAVVGGYDVRTALASVRGSLGLCPQHNILFEELTVEEHIVFYSSLKGMPAAEIGAEVTKYLALIRLEPKRRAQAHTLSGGMKRKLSVCVAFCGGSKVVLCDEPTSGMDPAARRALWDVLQQEKVGRTVLLSTHFMDEADVLGDRIAIMANGRVKCCGSSYFLKKRFGIGYRLVCVKAPKCRPEAVTTLLRGHCSAVRVENNVGTELSYQLSDGWAERFPDMFVELEDRLEEVGLSGFGLSLTTMEEVFMAVGTDGKELLVVPGVGGERTEEEVDMLFNSLETAQTYTGLRLIVTQIAALLHKKVLQTSRHWIMLLIHIIIPATFIIVTILAEQSRARFGDLPALPVDYSTYDRTETLLDASRAQQADATPAFAAIADAYRQLFADRADAARHSLSEIAGNGMERHVLDAYAANTPRMNRECVAGATIGGGNNETTGGETLVAWFNNQPLHTAALTVRQLHNAVLRATLGAAYGIEVTNAPMAYTADARSEIVQVASTMGFQLAVNVSFAMAFVSAFFVLAYIRERTSGSKHLQMVSGARIISYWMTALVWDFLTFILTVAVLLIVFAAFGENGWSTPTELVRITAVLAMFGWSMLPCTYLASRLFSVPASGYTRMAMFYVFTGMACFFIVVLMSLPMYNLRHIADGLTWGFLAFPHFGLSHSLNSINLVVQGREICRLRCEAFPGCTEQIMCAMLPQCCYQSYFAWESPGIGRNILYFAVTGAVALAYLLLLEYRVFTSLRYRIRALCASRRRAASATTPDATASTTPRPPVDSDVLAEQQLVATLPPQTLLAQNLVVRSMSRDYGRFRAVNRLSMAVGEAECFGLLGINGAGKTSTFGMLTGALRISDGSAWVRGLSLRTQMTEVHKCIGYCPQFDALIGEMTGRETLGMFCALRGVRRRDVERLTRVLASELGFERHLDKRVAAYSGGNKRKLSTAVALVGNPQVVYLDEPTTGMDPNAKRCLWNVVSKVRRMGKSVVLTSHSMDECEALCTRLAIMVAGEFRCLGGVQHLKTKFAAGYTLVVKMRKAGGGEGDRDGAEVFGETVTGGAPTAAPLSVNLLPLKAFIRDRLPSAQLRQEFQEQLTYHIGRNGGVGDVIVAVDGADGPPPLRWSHMFAVMEEAKRTFSIEDYGISQTSLEQVFLSFVQAEAEANGTA